MERRSAQRKRRSGGFLLLYKGITGFLLILTVVLFCLFSCGRREEDRPADPTQTETERRTETDPELPAGWTWRKMSVEDLARGNLVLVNAEHSFDPTLPTTVSVYDYKSSGYLVKDVYLSVTRETVDHLNRWMDAFAAESGRTDVNIVAGYRTRADQEALYENAVNTKGRAHAEAYLALPGCSEHHTGLAVDLDTYDVEAGTSGGFDGEGDYAWAVEHAWEYGFIQRYPPRKSGITGINYESWHFRYVGLPHAWLMREEDLCLEEYVEYLRGFPFDQGPLTVNCLGRSWRIYYAQGPAVPVPAEGAYEISGNNVDGYIVTVPGSA